MCAMNKVTVAALQIGSDYAGKAATLRNILSCEDRIAASGARLVVMPEALLGGYPKGEQFGTRLGFRMPEGREAFARYYDNAVDMDGAELDALAGLSTRTGATLVLGVLGSAAEQWDADRPLIGGGSMIVGPLGDVLAGPLERDTGLLTAEIDTDELIRARYDLDVVGHYARPDVFSLHVDETPRNGAVFSGG